MTMSDPDDGIEMLRLRTLQQTGLLTSPAPEEFGEICQRAKEHFHVTVAMVTLMARDTLIAKARAGTDLEEVPRVGQFCDHTIRSDDVFVVPDARQDPRFAGHPVVTSEPFLRFYAGAPLIYLRSLRLGALCLLDPTPRDFSLGDRAELVLMADEVVNAVMEQSFSAVSGHVGPNGPR